MWGRSPGRVLTGVQVVALRCMIAADSAPFSLGGRAAAWAGGLAVLAMSVFLVGMLISQLLTPGYSVITDDMSSLGKTPGAGAVVYNLSVVLSGSGLTAFGALAFCASRRQPASPCIADAVRSWTGRPDRWSLPRRHSGSSAGRLRRFGAFGLTALASYTVQRGWPAYLSAIVGTTTLAMVILTLATFPCQLPTASRNE